MNRRQAMARALSRALQIGLLPPLACACLGLALYVVDYPEVDALRAPHVKKVRLADQDGVFREEGFSRFRTNAYGLIGAQPAPASETGVYRVAVFGDSFVEALQVPPAESLTGWLERLLPRPAGYRRVETWNFGFSGDGTGNAYARWVYRPAGVRFDLAVVTFNAGDVFDNDEALAKRPYGAFLVEDGHGGFRLDESRIAASPVPAREVWVKRQFGRLVYSAYKLSRRIEEHLAEKRASARAALARLVGGGRVTPVPAPTPRDASAHARLIAKTCAQLLYVRDAIAAEGTTVVLAALPDSETVLRPEVDRVYSELTACVRGHRAALADPLRELARSYRDGVDPYRDWNEPGGHLNRVGHRVVASAIVSALGGAGPVMEELR